MRDSNTVASMQQYNLQLEALEEDLNKRLHKTREKSKMKADAGVKSHRLNREFDDNEKFFSAFAMEPAIVCFVSNFET